MTAQDWSLTLPHPQPYESSQLAIAPDGNIWVADSHESLDTTTVSKISPAGNLIWQKQIKIAGIWENGSADTQKKGCVGIYFEPDGSAYLLLNRNPSLTVGIEIVRVDAAGNEISRVWKTLNNWTMASARTSDGNFVLTRTPGYGLSKIAADGTTIWQNTTSPASINFTNSLAQTSNGDLWTFSNGFFQSGSGGVLNRANSLGVVQNTWAMPSQTGGYSTYNICAGADGNVLLASSNAAAKIFRRIMAPDGTVVFSASEDASADIEINAVLPLSDGYVLAGRSAGGLYFWRLDLNGSIIFEKHVAVFGLPEPQSRFASLALVPGTQKVVGCGRFGEESVGSDVFVMQFDASIPPQFGLIRGKVRLDPAGDCAADSLEVGMAALAMLASTPTDSFYTFTNSAGDYHFWLDTGSYSIQVIDNHPLILPCPLIETAVVDGSGDTLGFDFWAANLYPCPLMEVSFGSANLRRCFPNTLVLSYCNRGTVAAADARVEILLDPRLDFISSSLPLSGTAGDTLIFNLGDVAAGVCQQFNIVVEMVDCDSIALGTFLCSDAWIFPDTICGEFPNWNGASVGVGAKCVGSEVKLFVTNRGTAPTSSAVDYIVTEDNVILMQGSSNLAPTDTTWLTYPNNGHLWRIAAEQEPGHPNEQVQSAFLRNCVSDGHSAFVSWFSESRNSFFHDVLCRTVVGSFDPNEKSAFPRGYGASHQISRRDEIEYLIQFQNTGTDTAFTVVVRDTLSQNLDPASVRVGASSHPMTWEMEGQGVLVFKFENILLPDSNVNEAASHSWLTFRIAQKPMLAWGSRIENQAAIFFDFNPPIFTSTVFHTVDTNFIVVKSIETFHPKLAVAVFPNPFFEKTTLKINGLEISDGAVQIFDVQNQLLRTQNFSGKTCELRRDGLPNGFYFFRVFEAGRILAAGKMVVGGSK